MKGKRPRKRKPNFKRGQIVRINRGLYVGCLGIVYGTHKNKVIVECEGAPYTWRRHHGPFKASALDKVVGDYHTMREVGQVNLLIARLGDDWWKQW